MTEQDKIDIRRIYRDSKDKRKEVGILAECYATSKETIREILGVEKPGKKADPETEQRPEAPRRTEKIPDEIRFHEKEDKLIDEAVDIVLKEFDRNEEIMRILREKIAEHSHEMAKLAAEYKKTEEVQRKIVGYLERYCKVR